MTLQSRRNEVENCLPITCYSPICRRAISPFFATLALLVSLLPAGCERGRSPSPKPNILLIVVDTLRADRLGSYGNAQGLTPFLDRFAAQALVFRHAYAPSSWTRPSMASLFTSRYPSQHGVVKIRIKLADAELTLAEILQQHGYRTAAFVTNVTLTPYVGFGQGFQSYVSIVGEGRKPRAELVRLHTLAWLDGESIRHSDSPLFLYLHYMEPHVPYSPPPPYVARFVKPGSNIERTIDDVNLKHARVKGRQLSGTLDAPTELTCEDLDALEAVYNAEVAALDFQLETLFADLQERGFLQNAIVVVSADHGEEFLEHGNLFHGNTLYDESIRVPLIVRVPKQTGIISDRPTSLLDIAPSILDLLDIPVPEVFEGHSFAKVSAYPVLASLSSFFGLDPPVVAELQPLSTANNRCRHTAAIIEGSHKLLAGTAACVEAYDLRQDPFEEIDGAGVSSSQRTRLLATLYDTLKSFRDGAVREEVTLDETTQARLEALGYTVDAKAPPDANTSEGAAATEQRAKSRRSRCAPAAAGPNSRAAPLL